MKFCELFQNYRVLRPEDKVRNNSRNDYNLPEGWVYITGKHIGGKWTVVYGILHGDRSKEARPNLVNGEIGSVALRPQFTTGEVKAVISPTCLIGSYKFPQAITDIPDFFKEVI